MLHNSHQFHVLGNVPEAERNWLLSNCLAVFQPSLYEGWSTTIEEAISFGKLVLASSIPPNLEQLSDYPPKFFFDPNNENSIISCLSHLTSNTAPNLLTVEELSEIRVGRWHRFRQDLLNLIRTILSQH
jgi:glycosyltransferase involved in cell wall biosynthesis